MPKFVITKRANGEFAFTLKADNGRALLSSESFASTVGIENAIAAVKQNIYSPGRYIKRVSKKGKPFFLLAAQNGQVLGYSEFFESERERDMAIEALEHISESQLEVPSDFHH